MSFYDFYNVQMLQAMQQFYATSDLSSQLGQLLLGPQQLFMSNNTITPNELHLQSSDLYLESESNNEAVALQAPETSTPVVIHTSANEEIIPEAQPIYRGEKEMKKLNKEERSYIVAADASNKTIATLQSRAANAHKRTVDPSNNPEDLRNVPGGEVFLQLQTDDLHIHFSRKVVELARDHGLHALIGDGVHKLNPVTIPNRMDKGQLYVVHAAIQGGIEVPLLYAVTRFKTVGTYKIVFESLREVLGEYKERFVVDFEKAAIRAARETFPEADVQGCAFHLAQAWNRASVNLGLRKFIRGPKAVLEDYRTTNAAEAFHSKLRGMLSKRINPPFEELLECLHSINSLALGMLKHVQENARASRALRKKDQERRDKINNAMDEFKEMFRLDDDLEIDVINNYCRKMSQFVTEKTI
ncbi:unnamed protein product [Cylicocyclus nassatus]|uniref:MULE transposase domain-containing protein n=1 Tax=Cylicocyclus nassatus TaxID=53992 RepID=A0AA36H167_CYLNA|nr:unnamed protein product [Cylicocyclus nassatus]